MSDNLPALSGNLLDALPVPAQPVDDSQFEEMAKRGNFLSRLVLYSKQGEVLDGKIGPGQYGIPTSKESLTVIGNKVDLIPLARRVKAIDMSDRNNIVESYDPSSDVFNDIKDRSSVKDSGCMYGISFLCIERTTGKFVEWYCGSKTTRAVAGQIYPYLPVGAAEAAQRGIEPRNPTPFTMGVELIESKGYKWHGPTVKGCSTPFNNVPSPEATISEIQKFLNPKTATTSVAADGAEDDDR